MSSFPVRPTARLCLLFLPYLFLLTLVPCTSSAKTVGLTVIEIYPAHDGQSVLQIADFVMNGKNEVYLCPPGVGIEKSDYHKLTKVTLAAGMTLERDAKGILMLRQGTDAPACAVPANLKLDRSGTFSPSELVDRTILEGRVLTSSEQPAPQIIPLKPGVKLVFVPGPDLELSEYLRAERAGHPPAWQGFLAKYPTGPHASDAKKALATLYVQAAESNLQAFESSKTTDNPDYAKLEESRQLVDKARALMPSDDHAKSLDQKVHAEVVALSSSALSKLKLYEQALNDHSVGYSNLLAAEKFANAAVYVDPSSPEAVQAQGQTKKARASFDKVLRDFDLSIASQHLDDAAQQILPLRSFADENSKVADDLRSVSSLYVASAKKLEETSDWTGAVQDLKKAADITPSSEVLDLLKTAKQQETAALNKKAADTATAKSQSFESDGDIISAYEVLDDLPRAQHALVTERLDSLKDKYLKQAQDKATRQQKAHYPINGLSDETGIQEAYDLLQRCSLISDNSDIQTRILVLADYLSDYYLKQGTRYVAKPAGIGSNVGWTYLTEALQYKSQSNSSAIHDARAGAGPAHRIKSGLSISVDFRDQTSRRDGSQIADALTDALANGLESSGLTVKVYRKEATAVPTNFQLIGDVLEKGKSNTPTTVSKESKYHSSDQQVRNEAYVSINRELQHAQSELKTAQNELEGARGNKKLVNQALQDIADNQKKVDALQAKLDATSPTNLQAVETAYRYKQVTYSLRIVVALQFRILDSANNEVVQRVPIHKESAPEYTVLQEVSPQDSQGVRIEGTVPNDDDFFDHAANEARQELIKEAHEKVSQLPGIVLATADRRAADGDWDGAAEQYILYLNCTPVADTPERLKARRFLVEHFNFRDIGKEAQGD
jgi:hypothetical protein